MLLPKGIVDRWPLSDSNWMAHIGSCYSASIAPMHPCHSTPSHTLPESPYTDAQPVPMWHFIMSNPKKLALLLLLPSYHNRGNWDSESLNDLCTIKLGSFNGVIEGNGEEWGRGRGPNTHSSHNPAAHNPTFTWPIINRMKGTPDKCPCQGEILPSLRNNVISRLLPKIIYQCVIALCRPQIGGELCYQRWM